jgi:hypothetical protein
VLGFQVAAAFDHDDENETLVLLNALYYYAINHRQNSRTMFARLDVNIKKLASYLGVPLLIGLLIFLEVTTLLLCVQYYQQSRMVIFILTALFYVIFRVLYCLFLEEFYIKQKNYSCIPRIFIYLLSGITSTILTPLLALVLRPVQSVFKGEGSKLVDGKNSEGFNPFHRSIFLALEAKLALLIIYWMHLLVQSLVRTAALINANSDEISRIEMISYILSLFVLSGGCLFLPGTSHFSIYVGQVLTFISDILSIFCAVMWLFTPNYTAEIAVLNSIFCYKELLIGALLAITVSRELMITIFSNPFKARFPLDLLKALFAWVLSSLQVVFFNLGRNRFLPLTNFLCISMKQKLFGGPACGAFYEELCDFLYSRGCYSHHNNSSATRRRKLLIINKHFARQFRMKFRIINSEQLSQSFERKLRRGLKDIEKAELGEMSWEELRKLIGKSPAQYWHNDKHKILIRIGRSGPSLQRFLTQFTEFTLNYAVRPLNFLCQAYSLVYPLLCFYFCPAEKLSELQKLFSLTFLFALISLIMVVAGEAEEQYWLFHLWEGERYLPWPTSSWIKEMQRNFERRSFHNTAAVAIYVVNERENGSSQLKSSLDDLLPEILDLAGMKLEKADRRLLARFVAGSSTFQALAANIHSCSIAEEETRILKISVESNCSIETK